MKLIGRLFRAILTGRQRRHPGYDAEILFSGWVELPEAFYRLRD